MAAMTALLTQFSEAIRFNVGSSVSPSHARIASATSLSVFWISSKLYILSPPYNQPGAVGAFLLTRYLNHDVVITMWLLYHISPAKKRSMASISATLLCAVLLPGSVFSLDLVPGSRRRSALHTRRRWREPGQSAPPSSPPHSRRADPAASPCCL